jgi:HSP20 family molecular chaperone IbpA
LLLATSETARRPAAAPGRDRAQPRRNPTRRVVTHTDDAFLLEIDLPGVTRENLAVETAGSELRVSGEITERERSAGYGTAPPGHPGASTA